MHLEEPPRPSTAHPWQWRVAALTILIVLAALARLVPHPPNFTPIGAMAIFGGACFADRRVALLLPLATLLLGDFATSVPILMPVVAVVYVSFALNVLIARALRKYRNADRSAARQISGRTAIAIVAVTLVGSAQFFVITNFASWIAFDPHTADGLVTCYTKAIPYFRNTLLGDAVFVGALFGGLALVERAFPVLREPGSIPVAA